MDEIKIQYEKKQKKNKKDHFEILSIEPVKETDAGLLLPHKSYLMHSQIKANHAVYRSMGKEETILSMQLTTYCDVTKRLVIASMIAPPEQFQAEEKLYRKILFSLTCHE